ncbi:XopAD/skwp family type III secretion system effector [Ralstonia solanacearum species complex bacterium KE056]|uniref:XopAD/skwp family type III secretion system effector n=1 Tax=Ralstonia solanacearum species complex bacterium KE056 TaxID=3119585 RepID=UPI002FC35015
MESRVSEPAERDVHVPAERAASQPRSEDLFASDAMRSTSPPNARHAVVDTWPTRAQLTDYRQWLDAKALRQLNGQREAQCRQLQALVDDAWNQKVDLQRCAQLTSDNILAQRNRCGQALVFLDGTVPADENARRVGDYLWVLSQSSSAQAGWQGQRQLECCVDLAASYLFKTHWFDQAPCTQLSNLGNLLSKYPSRPAAMEAIAWIAGQVVASVRLPRLNGKQLALLANAFSKNTDSQRCERAVARIASQGLDDCEEALATQSVSLLLNAMSKWPDNAACRATAERLATWLADDAGMLREMSAQHVASTFNALSKWPDSVACGKVVERLAERVAKESRLRQALSAQQVANALNAMSKWPKAAACRTGALHLARRVADDDRILSTLNPQGVAIALNALCKWPDADACGKAVERLAERLIRERGLRQAMSAQNVANALNALSKWPNNKACRQAAVLLAERVANESRLREAMNAQQVANTVGALGKWSDEAFCKAAVERLAVRLAADAGLRRALSTQQFVNTLSGLSKWPKSVDCGAAVRCLAVKLVEDAAVRQALDAQGIANTLSALGKWSEASDCRIAAGHLAARLASDSGLRQALDAQGVASALNGLSKWPEADDCRTVAKHLAGRLTEDAALRQALDAQGVSSALNALSKWSTVEDCRVAAEHLAERLATEADLRQALDAQGVANTLNALSKWPDTAVCKAVAELLAARLANEADLRRALSAQGMANALNALSKWPNVANCRLAAELLAGQLLRDAALWQAMNAQEFANTLSALSKWPDTDDCRLVAERMAAHLDKQADLRQALDAQGIANALNALSKWSDTAVCRAAAEHLATRLAEEADLRQAMDVLGIVGALGALSRWPDADTCRLATEGLAARLAREPALLQAMSAPQFASTLNALSKWPHSEACQQTALHLVDALGSGGRPFGAFDMGALAKLANGTARFAVGLAGAAVPDDEDNDDDGQADAALSRMHACLRELAAHLNVRPEGLDAAETRDLAMIFKALATAGLKDGLKLLAHQGLQRLHALHEQTCLRPDSLETLGSLAAGLLPLVRSPELKAFRADTLRLLERIQTDVARKVRHYTDAHAASAALAKARSPEGEAFGARRPGLTFFLLLKTYAVVAAQWKQRNVTDDRAQVEQRREALQAWIGNTLEQVRGAIEGDLDEMSWNLIAQIEAGDHVLDALDLKLHRDMDRITTVHPPTPMDVAAVRRELRDLSAVRNLMGSKAGAALLQVVDMRGNLIRSGPDALENYSFFTRLTGGKLPLIEVELPGKVSAFMLTRTLQRDGDLLRMDLFGGSHLTPPNPRVFELLSGAQGPARRYGRIPAIRLADTVPHAPLMKDVIRKLNPQREDWYRMQRALLEVVPRDHVVEGPVRLALQADRPQGAEPAFALRLPTGEPIHLVSHDGCGFIRESLARRIPAMGAAMDEWARSRRQAGWAPPAPSMTSLPPQATHHYPRNTAAIEEARTHLRRVLQEDPTLWQADAPEGTRRLGTTRLYELLVGAGITGVQGIAVPSADSKLYLPGGKGDPFDRAGGPVLLGKPPYDKPNLIPVPAEHVGTPGQGDATARFLDTTFALQYSYTAWDESRTRTARDDAPMLHGKGVAIVVPDALWPKDNDAQWVWSTEDMKVHSSWTRRRERDRLPARMDTVGSLRLKDIFPPGTLIAVPIDELGKRDADCDGDKVFVYAGAPKMAEAISGFFAARERRIGRMPSFKPLKTASAAVDEAGHYHAGRAAEVLSAVRGQELVRRMSTFQFHFWGQPQALRERIAEQAIFGTFEGTRRELRRGLRRLLYNPAAFTPASRQALCKRARLGAVHAEHPTARQAAEILRDQLEAFVQALDGPTAPAGQPQALPSALAQRFTALAEAYAQAGTARERLEALANHYPTALLPHPGTALPEDYPDDPLALPEMQLGYVSAAPMETLRNLLTLGVKVGTDAPKAVTQTDVYLKIAERLDRTLRSEPDRIRLIPYTKSGLVRKLRDGIDVPAEQQLLRDNPSLTAGLMEMALEELQPLGLIDTAPAPGAVSTETASRVWRLAHALHAVAELADARVTGIVERAIDGIGESRGEAHRVKSASSLYDKLLRLMHKGRLSPEDAAATVDDGLRYSVVLAAETFVQRYADILGRLDAQGLTRTQVRNRFNRDHTAFKGVKVGFTAGDADGKAVRLEIQFHTQETFALKERFHDDYKDAQALYLAGADREQRHAALAQAREAFAPIATPPGSEHILDWDSAPPRTARPRVAAAAAPAAGAKPAREGLAGHVERVIAQARAIQLEVTPLLEAIGLAIVKSHSTPKPATSVRKKIERYQTLEGRSLEQAAASVYDAMRWVVLLPAERFGAEFRQARLALEAKGLHVMRIRNGFAVPNMTYAGVNVIVRSPAGRDFEMQFHTEDSLHVRNTSHQLYRAWQDQEVKIGLEQDPVKRQALQQANAQRQQLRRERAAQVALPTGAKGIVAFDALRDAVPPGATSTHPPQRGSTTARPAGHRP